jgi:hypothetical protein
MTFEEKKKIALGIDTKSYLDKQGYSPADETSTYYLYLSPLPEHNERKASFAVRKKDGRWRDFVLSDRWDRVVSLCMQVECVNFVEAVNRLSGFSEHDPIIKKFTKPNDKDIDLPRIELVGDPVEIQRSNLIKYLKDERGVDVDIAKKYCKQIKVRFPVGKYPDSKITLIGFPNVSGGFDYRDYKFKGSTIPKIYSLIGDLEAAERFIFEGFMDFLSFLTDLKVDEVEGLVIVLNSLSLMSREEIYELLRKNGTNYLFLDNDKEADKRVKRLEKEDIPFEDCRPSYGIYHDYNDKINNKINF